MALSRLLASAVLEHYRREEHSLLEDCNQVTTGEGAADCEDSARAVLNCKCSCELFNNLINQGICPKPVYSHYHVTIRSWGEVLGSSVT
jgi:hypothetical protein